MALRGRRDRVFDGLGGPSYGQDQLDGGFRDTLSELSGRCGILILIWSVALGLAYCATECTGQENPQSKDDKPAAEPCRSDPSSNEPCVDPTKIPRFGANSPFDGDQKTPLLKKERRLWANSWIWAKAPEFEVEKWLTDKPDTKGKYVLIEFWATWCGPCRRSIPLLNGLHRKYGDEFIVIGICEEAEEEARKLNEKHPQTPQIEFYSAIDTKKRMKDKLGVWGIPHVIILEPGGHVIWEGFPLQPGYELTDEIAQRILAVGRKLRAKDSDAAVKQDAEKAKAN
ncbi:MAG: TlpA family protein disulfide reductase [Planctomycetes bacterium]|nr:TlpA family protein disulfide reductase [Planctomycetota bacterium]